MRASAPVRPASCNAMLCIWLQPLLQMAMMHATAATLPILCCDSDSEVLVRCKRTPLRISWQMIAKMGCHHQVLFTAINSNIAQHAGPVTVFHWLMSNDVERRHLRMLVWLRQENTESL